MGITLYYRGRIHPKEKPRNVYLLAKIFCEDRDWEITDFIEEANGKVAFARTPGQKEYRGPVASFSIAPHGNCEPVAFAFTREGLFEDRCKTQFAPAEIHVAVVELLESLRPRLAELVVQDEGHYWETRDREKLEANLLRCLEEILKAKEENPDYYGPVKEDDGRITDLVRG